MPEKLYVKIYKTTNNNYRAEVALTSGWSQVVGAPVRVHPLLAGCETVETLFERISIIYPDIDLPNGAVFQTIKDKVYNEGGVLVACQEVKGRRPVTLLDVRSAKLLSGLMRYIDAYAADYAAEGKLAPSRQDVEKLLGENLSLINNAITSNFGRQAGSSGSDVSNLRRSHFIALREVLAYAKETGVDWLCLVDAQRSLDADIIGED